MAKKKGPPPKKATVKKVNPFELKFNKVKHSVLGQKKNVNAIGRPGLSRKKAYQHREETLGIEHSRVGNVNKILDRRLGEKDQEKSAEEKASIRFTAERMKNFKKASKFNLTDDDDLDKLTHKGESLTSIQKYDRTAPSDDEEDDGPGSLSAHMVKIAHFGGGEEKKEGEQRKTRKDVIAELIAKTKQQRHDKFLAKEDQEIMTDNLDEKYKNLLSKLNTNFRPIGATKNEKSEGDDYDKLMLQLKLAADAKATPAERTKSEKERIADEKARLEELENSRLARMNGYENGKRHLPVDVDIDPDRPQKKKKARFELRYDEAGQIINKDKIEKNSLKKVAIDSEASDEEEEPDDDDEDLDDLINGDNEDEEAEEVIEDEGDDEENEDEEVENEEDENEDDEEEDIDEAEEEEPAKSKKKELAENGDIPFVFDFPGKYNDLVEIFNQYGTNNAGVILERIVKCHHPSLKEGNKDLMKKLFLFSLRFYDETSKETITAETVETLGVLIKSLYSIMKLNLEYSVRCVRALIRQTWNSKMQEKTKKPASFTVLAVLRLVASLFPVSDIWHPVCSPAMMLATHSLAHGLVPSLTAVARQIFLLSNILDYVEESKRYVPEAIGFVQGALTLAVEDSLIPAPSNSFPISKPHSQMLLIHEAVTSDEALKPLKLTEIYSKQPMEDNDINRSRILRVLLACVKRLRVLYAVHEATFTTVFKPLVDLLKKIPASLLHSSTAEDLESLITSAEAECRAKSKLVQMSRIKTEKTMLKMLEPKFEMHFDPERPRLSRDSYNKKSSAAEKSKLKYMYKKEMRGAIREVRKDTAYLGRKQRHDVASKDKDRRQKTKRLMSELQSQQGEWNKEMREGGKKSKKK